MTATRGEKLAYARGYNRGRVRAYGWINKLAALARAYRDMRLTPGEPHRCDGCRRWTRGGGLRGSEMCQWGVCSADFEWGVEPRMWIDALAGDRPREITTSQDFGCASWLPVSLKGRPEQETSRLGGGEDG